MFRIGQRVACVDASNQGAREFPIRLGDVYTISAITYAIDYTGSSGSSIFLAELPHEICPVAGEPIPFAIERFRPIVERKTDISIFEEILRRESMPDECAPAAIYGVDWGASA